MPHITTAMEWSRRRGIGETMLDSFIRRRSVSGEISSVKDSFSSWSNCMAATYCKLVHPFTYLQLQPAQRPSIRTGC
ncbi:hypothetical protein CJF31_00009100 [Rutstroemia sp. NJR-2017a BVV2]|nr:hypothetical protein CJF31_00009100 [Rutstroemia sp. NJR-2017a BVV2]